MPDAKLIAQIGPIIGREFPYELIAAVPDLSEPVLRRGLAELVDSGLVSFRGEKPNAVYSFKHSLVRDALYESLLRSRRRAFHGAIVTELIRRSDAGEEVSPDLLAYHCERAGMVGTLFATT